MLSSNLRFLDIFGPISMAFSGIQHQMAWITPKNVIKCYQIMDAIKSNEDHIAMISMSKICFKMPSFSMFPHIINRGSVIRSRIFTPIFQSTEPSPAAVYHFRSISNFGSLLIFPLYIQHHFLAHQMGFLCFSYRQYHQLIAN